MHKRRLKACVEAWPECEEGKYNPACCRFPKSCSCTVYRAEYVSESDLEDESDDDPHFENLIGGY